MKKILKKDMPKHPYHILIRKVKNFQAKGVNTIPFTYLDVLEKFGYNPKCYLTGYRINWFNTYNYDLDHVIPASRGGLSNLDNLNLLWPPVNQMKFTMQLSEMINLIRHILEYNSSNPDSLNNIQFCAAGHKISKEEMNSIVDTRKAQELLDKRKKTAYD